MSNLCTLYPQIGSNVDLSIHILLNKFVLFLCVHLLRKIPNASEQQNFVLICSFALFSSNVRTCADVAGQQYVGILLIVVVCHISGPIAARLQTAYGVLCMLNELYRSFCKNQGSAIYICMYIMCNDL
jgi:hypothetical protein